MQSIVKRLSSLTHLARPLALTFIGVVLLSLSFAYGVISLYRTATLPSFFFYLTLQFLPHWMRGLVLGGVGLIALAAGIWQLSGVVVIPINVQSQDDGELVLGYRQVSRPPNIAVLSGGPGMLVLAGLGQHAQRMTCITPIQDPVEYYYRAASLFQFENVIYVPPSPVHLQVYVELDDGTRCNIKQNISHDELLAQRHVVNIALADEQGLNGGLDQLSLTRQTLKSLNTADVIILGPGSLFASIIPNLLIDEFREAVKSSRARKVYVCNLMTEPGMTTGFTVADHIRQIDRFGGFTPDYVLVNVQRIEPQIRQLYEAAHQTPVYLTPEEYEETVVSATDRVTAHDVIVEGAVVIEADLASSVVQLTASLGQPGESRAVRVLRHDPEKLTVALLEILRRIRS